MGDTVHVCGRYMSSASPSHICTHQAAGPATTAGTPWLRPEPIPEDLQPRPLRFGAQIPRAGSLLDDTGPVGAVLGGIGACVPTPPAPSVLDVQHVARALQQQMGQRLAIGAALSAQQQRELVQRVVALKAAAPLTLVEVQAQLCGAREVEAVVAAWQAGRDRYQQLPTMLLQADVDVAAVEGVPLASMQGTSAGRTVLNYGLSLGLDSVPAAVDAVALRPVVAEEVAVLSWSEQQLVELVQQAGQQMGSSAAAMALAAEVAKGFS